MLPAGIRDEIVACLRPAKDVRQVLLFGSYATNTNNSDSDVDIVVITSQPGIKQDFSEIASERKRISSFLKPVRRKIPMDILVYTSDEWALLHEEPNDFIRKIDQESVRLI